MGVSGITAGVDGGLCITQKYRKKKPEMPAVVPIILTNQSVAIRCPNAMYQGTEGRDAGLERDVTDAAFGKGERHSLCNCIA
jgi:hypothetical protein